MSKILTLDNIDAIKEYVDGIKDNTLHYIDTKVQDELNTKIDTATEAIQTEFEKESTEIINKITVLEQTSGNKEEIAKLQDELETLRHDNQEFSDALASLKASIYEGSILDGHSIEEIINTAMLKQVDITDDSISAENLFAKKMVALVGKFAEVQASKITGDRIVGKTISSTNTVDGQPSWELNNNGSGHFANNNISWDKDGNVTLSKNVIISYDSLSDEAKENLKGEKGSSVRLSHIQFNNVEELISYYSDGAKGENGKPNKEYIDYAHIVKSGNDGIADWHNHLFVYADVDIDDESISDGDAYYRGWSDCGQFSGQDGKDGQDGQSAYVYVRYAKAIEPNVIFTDEKGTSTTDAKFMGICTTTKELTDDTNLAELPWNWTVLQNEDAISSQVATEMGKYHISSNHIAGQVIDSASYVGDKPKYVTLKADTKYIKFNKNNDGTENIDEIEVQAGGEGPAWQLRPNGDGYLAAGNIAWDEGGNVTLGETVTINGMSVLNSLGISSDIENEDGEEELPEIDNGNENGNKINSAFNKYIANNITVKSINTIPENENEDYIKIYGNELLGITNDGETLIEISSNTSKAYEPSKFNIPVLRSYTNDTIRKSNTENNDKYSMHLTDIIVPENNTTNATEVNIMSNDNTLEYITIVNTLGIGYYGGYITGESDPNQGYYLDFDLQALNSNYINLSNAPDNKVGQLIIYYQGKNHYTNQYSHYKTIPIWYDPYILDVKSKIESKIKQSGIYAIPLEGGGYIQYCYYEYNDEQSQLISNKIYLQKDARYAIKFVLNSNCVINENNSTEIKLSSPIKLGITSENHTNYTKINSGGLMTYNNNAGLRVGNYSINLYVGDYADLNNIIIHPDGIYFNNNKLSISDITLLVDLLKVFDSKEKITKLTNLLDD
jgi:hypothetical protein